MTRYLLFYSVYDILQGLSYTARKFQTNFFLTSSMHAMCIQLHYDHSAQMFIRKYVNISSYRWSKVYIYFFFILFLSPNQDKYTILNLCEYFKTVFIHRC